MVTIPSLPLAGIECRTAWKAPRGLPIYEGSWSCWGRTAVQFEGAFLASEENCICIQPQQVMLILFAFAPQGKRF